MDYDSNSDEGRDEEFPINRESHFPLTPNPKDYESSSDEGQDDEFLVNRESCFPLSHNP